VAGAGGERVLPAVGLGAADAAQARVVVHLPEVGEGEWLQPDGLLRQPHQVWAPRHIRGQGGGRPFA
jgi:hypothetical protein